MISAAGISKSYGTIQVLNKVDFEIEKSEVVSIVGPSGAGKSTLLHILGTLDKPDSGSVVFDGQVVSNLRGKGLAAFRNKHIGFVFQFHNLLPEFTALENVCIPAFIGGKSRTDAESKATELLEYLGLSHRIHHKPNEMSGGEQQRVSVARALVNSPSIILADEPSGNLDSAKAKELHQLFFELRSSFGITFVIVTHNEELAAMADRKVVMQDGRLMV